MAFCDFLYLVIIKFGGIMSESRKKNSSVNLIWSLIKFTVSIITAFTLRTLTLKAFGGVFSGLISLYSNIISILSITELGIGSALIYKLYKPVAEGDDTNILYNSGNYFNVGLNNYAIFKLHDW